MKRFRYRAIRTECFLIACFVLLCVPFSALAAEREEKVRVGFFAFDGYHMIDENGNRSGYGYDLLQHMVGYTSWQYEYVGYDKSWSEMQDMLANGEIDILSSAQKTEQRMERFDFSDEAVGISSAILTVKAGNKTYMLQDYANWSGMRIGLLEGNSRNDDIAEFAAEKGFTYTPVYFENISALVDALQEGEKIDAAVTSNLRAVSNESVLAKFAPSPFYIMVKKGNSELLDQINETLELLYCDHPSLQTELMEKYYTPKSGDEISYTAEERRFITEMQDVTFTAFFNPDRVPLSYFVNGEAMGIIGELATEICKRTGLNIEIKELDSRKDYLSLLGSDGAEICFDFTHDYSTAEKFGYHLTAPYIDAGISKLYLKKNAVRQTAGLVTGSYIVAGLEEKIKADYDKVKFYPSTEELVDAIEAGKCDVGYFYTRVCERLVLDDARNRLASELVYDTNISFCVAIRTGGDPRLFSILDKAVASLGNDIINSVVLKYTAYEAKSDSFISFIYDNPFVFVSFVVVLFVLLILTAMFILITRKRKLDAERLAEEKRQNVLLSDALAAAKVADEAKNSFLSHMSHEMRTPLNAVIGFMELAKDGTHEQRSTYRENALIAAKQLLSIINDVLDMSAINTGKLKIACEPFDFKELIKNITNMYAIECEAKGVELRVVLETPVDERLIGDALRLNQILMNLLGNAVKFTDRGFVSLSLRERIMDNNRIFLRFVVADSGCGMSENMLSRIGTPFEQESADTARKHGGSGLGLSIVKMLTSMMGGAFKAESSEGVGSSFTVELPFTTDGVESASDLAHISNDLYVLAVDNQAADSAYLSTLLSRMRVRHTCVKTDMEVLRELERASEAGDCYNVAILDWTTRDMGGVALTRRIREKYSKAMIVVVISAYDHQQNMDVAKEAGADMFISKPLLQSNLLDLFMTLTGGRMIKPRPAVRAEADFSGKRILLAEDNAMNRMVAGALLNKIGVISEAADDGKKALEMFSASEPGYYDAILMDIQMPNMDGYEATRAIRASGHPDAKNIVIIALSANAFNEDVARSLSNGMDDHVGKPIDMAHLTSALQRAFDKNGR